MKTIAIIDDDIHIGDMLTEVLTQEGYAVLRAYSGTEAIYLLSQNKPDLVLLDLMLPGLSGEEVLPHIENAEIISSLINKRNSLIRLGKYTDGVDEVIMKVRKAKNRNFQILYI